MRAKDVVSNQRGGRDGASCGPSLHLAHTSGQGWRTHAPHERTHGPDPDEDCECVHAALRRGEQLSVGALFRLGRVAIPRRPGSGRRRAGGRRCADAREARLPERALDRARRAPGVARRVVDEQRHLSEGGAAKAGEREHLRRRRDAARFASHRRDGLSRWTILQPAVAVAAKLARAHNRKTDRKTISTRCARSGAHSRATQIPPPTSLAILGAAERMRYAAK